ncbi:MAG TPA: DUF1684 domain-containing protein [Candidatus Didemnitutus sp.]|nr:DUF1684 domain-containing protein [Candidatus Didemnitutus sp.]
MRLFRFLVGLLLLTSASALAADDYAQSIDAWRQQRIARLTAPDSWLALVGRHPLPHGMHTLGSGANSDIKLATGPARLGTITYADDGKVTLALADGVDAKIDGTDARTAELVHHGEKPTYVHFGTANFYVMERGDQLFVRVRDTESPRRKNFPGIEYFPTDASWRIEAQWVKFDQPRTVKITNMIGQTSDEPVPGKAVFTRDGRTFELYPVDEDGELFFIVADETNGVETYDAGRFLYSKVGPDGKVLLDFNKIYNPPCVFTPFATCPMPPKENRLQLRVTAGEKKFHGESH